jgi:hypothetical protein
MQPLSHAVSHGLEDTVTHSVEICNITYQKHLLLEKSENNFVHIDKSNKNRHSICQKPSGSGPGQLLLPTPPMLSCSAHIAQQLPGFDP